MSSLDARKTTAKGFKKSGFIKNVVKVRLEKFDGKVLCYCRGYDNDLKLPIQNPVALQYKPVCDMGHLPEACS